MFSRRVSTVLTLVLVTLVAAALVVSAALPGLAAPGALPQHARLAGSAPADGATVRTAAEVVLTFSEDVDGRFLRLRVQGPGGDEAGGDPVVAGRSVTQPLVADLRAGRHTLTYRVVSVDGHPISGTVTFTTTVGPATSSPTPSRSAAATSPGPTPTAAASASSASSAASAASAVPAAPASVEGTPGWVLPAMILGLLALVGGGGMLAARGRRRRAEGADRGPA